MIVPDANADVDVTAARLTDSRGTLLDEMDRKFGAGSVAVWDGRDEMAIVGSASAAPAAYLAGVEAALAIYAAANINWVADPKRYIDKLNVAYEGVLNAILALVTPATDVAALVDNALETYTSLVFATRGDPARPRYAEEIAEREAEHDAARLALDAHLAARDREVDGLRRGGEVADGARAVAVTDKALASRKACPDPVRDAFLAGWEWQKSFDDHAAGLREALNIVREMNATGCTSLDIETDLVIAVDRTDRSRLDAEDCARLVI